MAQSSSRRRAKRLLVVLKGLQRDDFAIPGPYMLAIKHLLQISSRCALVEVDCHETDLLFESKRGSVPQFIISQLEAQKLIDRLSFQVPVTPLLAFVLLSLPSSKRQLDDGYPTLFRWYCREQRRTYVIFAFTKYKMARQKYSINELLELRNGRIINEISALSGNPEIGMCLAFPGYAC